MENKKLYIALASVGAAALGGLAYWFSKPEVTEASPSTLSKEDVMKIAKELKSQIFSTALQIIERRASVLAQIQQGASVPEGTTVESYVEEIASAMFAAKQRLICQKFEIQVSDFESAITNSYSNDKELNAIQSYIDKIFLDACNGIQPDMSLPKAITDFLTPAAVVLLHIKFFRLAASRYIKAFQEIKANGQVEMSFENPTFLRKIRELRIPEAKRQLLLSEGFDQFEQSPREILDKITQKYKLEDPEFEQGLQLYETSFSGLIDQLAADPSQFDPESTPNTIFPID